MLHKIRTAMGQREDLNQLEGMIEFDEGYFATVTNKEDKENQKRGRGSKKKKNAGVMAESTPLENLNTGKKSNQCRYFNMKVLENHKAGNVDQMISQNIDKKCIVFSDKSTSYVSISEYAEVHIVEKSPEETTLNTLKWVYIAISNTKRTLSGIYYKIKGKYLQAYLDEFCDKLNRRYFGEQLFDRLVVAIAAGDWYKKDDQHNN